MGEPGQNQSRQLGADSAASEDHCHRSGCRQTTGDVALHDDETGGRLGKGKFRRSSWKEGQSGFGTPGTPGAVIGTMWNTPDIWLRREVEIPADKLKNLELWIHHDDDAEIYINGSLVMKVAGWTTSYDSLPLTTQPKRR